MKKLLPLLLLPLLLTSCYTYRKPYTPAPPVQQQTYKMPHHEVNLLFADGQATQLQAALQNGISALADGHGIAPLVGNQRLQPVYTNDYYVIQAQEYGYPYLVPKAANLLFLIGRRVQQYSASHARIIATSELRTHESVRRLMRGNGNATTNSCHLYGTTFDIAYNSFDNQGCDPGLIRMALDQTLWDFRCMGLCYVKYEYNQHCYHITVR